MAQLESALDLEVSYYRSCMLAESTKKSYNSQRKSYLKFCNDMGYRAVPVTQDTLNRYTAFLARRLSLSSIKKYLNIIRIMHLENGFPNPLRENWFLDSILKGVGRDKGMTVKRKLPITPEILLGIRNLLNLSNLTDAMFWAACLTAFFGFFRKSNLFPPPGTKFDSDKHLCRSDFILFHWGIMVKIKYSKTIQFKERVLLTPLPLLQGHPLCPVTAITNALILSPGANPMGPAFLASHTQNMTPFPPSRFVQVLKRLLGSLGLPASEYSGHSFRRGSATWALAHGLPGETIKILGDWKSDAYMAYLSLSDSQKVTSIYQFSQDLPGSV